MLFSVCYNFLAHLVCKIKKKNSIQTFADYQDLYLFLSFYTMLILFYFYYTNKKFLHLCSFYGHGH